MSVPFEGWVAGGARLLVVDAADHVPDRRAFAAAHCPDGGGRETPADVREDDADGVLFLALDPAPTPPRVVTTLVGPDGRRTVSPAAARVAAAWVARRIGAEAVMVDTPRGTCRAAVADSSDGRGSSDGRDSSDGYEVVVALPRTEAEVARGTVVHTAGGTLARIAPRIVE